METIAMHECSAPNSAHALLSGRRSPLNVAAAEQARAFRAAERTHSLDHPPRGRRG